MRAGPGRTVVALGWGLLVATTLLLAVAAAPPLAHATGSPLGAWCFLIAGAALLLGGGLWAGRQPKLAAAAVLTTCAWLAPVWVGWMDALPLVRSVGMLLGPFAPAGLLLAVIALPPAVSRGALRVAHAACGLLAVLVIARALVRDPFLDLYCWNNCTHNVLLVAPDVGWARVLDRALLATVIATGLGVAAVGVHRCVRAAQTLRRTDAALAVCAAVAGVTEALYAVLLLADPFESPAKASYQAVFVVRATGLIAVGAALVWSSQRDGRRRRAVAHLVTEVAEFGGDVQSALRDTLHDPQLRLAFWSREATWVDAAGGPVDVDALPGRRTYLTRSNARVAVIVSSGGTPAHDDLEATLGTGARMALDNARLTASIRSQVNSIRASRARLVRAGDAARRDLERDLHDGAQQRLLAATFQLGLAARSAASRGDAPEVARLEAEVRALRQGLTALRELAHGIFPAVLDEAGLGAALSTFASKADVPVDLQQVPHGRLGAAAESAAYLLVTTAAEGACADGVRVSAVVHDGTLRARVDGCGPGPYVHCADRVGALGGTLSTGDGWLEAVIPCESSLPTTPS
jgi:signal transduction histidine kinase